MGNTSDDERDKKEREARHALWVDAVRNKVPLLAEINESVKNFGSVHQYMIQYMLKEGQVSQKRFYIAYIHYYVTMILDRAESVVSKIDADQSQLHDLTAAIVKRCNDKAKKIGIQLVQVRRESDGLQFVSVLTTKGFSRGIAARYGTSHDEKVFLSRMVCEFVKSNGVMSKETMCDVLRGIPNLTSAKSQKLLTKLIARQWIVENDDVYSMEPRAIAELSPLLRDKYQTPTCVFCQNLVIDRDNAGLCEQCEIYAHLFCIEKLSATGEVDCPLSCGCQIKKAQGATQPGTSRPARQNNKRSEGASDESEPEQSTRRKRPVKTEDDDADMD